MEEYRLFRKTASFVVLFLAAALCGADEIGDTVLFAPLHSHGILIDGRGDMYVASRGKTIFKILPDRSCRPIAKVAEDRPNTHIWSIVSGPDGFLYCAAKDSILKVSRDGAISAVAVNEAAAPDVGFGGLAFDAAGGLCVAETDRNIVLRYSPDFSQRRVTAGDGGERLLFPVGVFFDRPGKTMYVASCRTNSVVCFAPSGAVSIRTPGPCQYFDSDDGGDLYVSLVQSKAVFRIRKGIGTVVYMRPANGAGKLDFEFFNTVAVGRGAFGAQFLYFTSPAGVYRMRIR